MGVDADVLGADFLWSDVFELSDLDGGFAYVPGRALVADTVDFDVVASAADPDDAVGVLDENLGGFHLYGGFSDPVRAVAHLRTLGVSAQPDHILFPHTCDCCCDVHPADIAANPFRANPFRANPFRANPFRANPFRANPFRANPFRANSLDSAGPEPNSARPAKRPRLPRPPTVEWPPDSRVVVLDTGIADAAIGPALLAMGNVSGDVDFPDRDGDGWTDTVAGHGTFIAGIIQQLAPGCDIRVERAVHPLGYARESEVIRIILAEAERDLDERAHFMNLSFGGPVWTASPALERAVLKAQRNGIVVVASAGNDATCQAMYPAAIAGVVSVGAIGPDGPAPFTNYGCWVRACAPGVDLVSSFFDGWNGLATASSVAGDPDDFRGWARWSGTSFSAPMVVAALIREIRLSGCTPKQAVDRVIDAPWLGRIAGLGTVVNV